MLIRRNWWYPYSLCQLGKIINQNNKEYMSDYQKKKFNEQKEKLKKNLETHKATQMS